VLAAGLEAVTTAKALGLAASLALLGLLYRGLRRAGVPATAAGLAGLLLGSSFVFQIWSVAGLETNVFALLAFAGLVHLTRPPSARGALAGSAWLAAAALTRPEGLAWWAFGGAWMALGRDGRRRRVLAWAGPGLVLALHLAWRLDYYGALLPNTYYVKTDGAELWAQGLRGLGTFLGHPAHAAWMLAAILGVVAADRVPAWRRAAGVMAAVVLFHLLYVVRVGDDGLQVHRFYAPILAPLAWLAALSAAGGLAVRSLAIAAVALCAPLSVLQLRAIAPGPSSAPVWYQEGNVKLGRWLALHRGQETWIAVAAAGAIPYYSGLPSIDMYGLNDAHIARRPFPAIEDGRLMKWDNAYVLDRQPDLIAINRGYFRAGHPFAEAAPEPLSRLAVAPMDADLFRRIEERGGYRLAPIRFDDGSVFWVFEREEAAGATRSKTTSG